MSDPFSDIRPYRDEEVAPVLDTLLSSAEFLDALGSWRLGRLAGFAPGLVRPVVRRQLRKEVHGVTDVRTMQLVIERYMDRMIEKSTAGFSVSGLDALDPAQANLYISNHRDITMDPAFTNYALHQQGRDTVRIAIGDNLLTKPWVSDLMRLNKSFIVKRSVSGPRELLAASKTLSKYIRHSIQEERAPVWIAQREGRAKDGVDKTEPVIIKMLSMSRDKKSEKFDEHISSLNIVPVAISYELDPCDAMKAQELYQLVEQGSYAKTEHEDVASIARGIAGDKGRVHVSFGSPLRAAAGNELDSHVASQLETPDAVATEIDRQVLDLYCLHPTNLYAYRRLHGREAQLPDDVFVEEGVCDEAEFNARIDAMPEAHRPYALAIYANSVVSKLERAIAQSASC
ncbi:MAG: 1-acyl-sn-glycerol-3-phosphate acyltransferase [Halioglobus sp.]